MSAFTGWRLFVAFTVFYAWTDFVKGSIVSYNATSRQLTLRCPKEPMPDGEFSYIALLRQHDQQPLANWTYGDKGLAVYDRLSLRPATPPYVLEAVLDYVTCYDVATYTCSIIFMPFKDSSRIVHQSEPFTFEGEVTDPVLRVTPRQARYQEGNIIKLTCSARIGTHNNSIVWETRLPGEDFSLVTGDCESRTNISESNPTQPKATSCSVTSESTVTHIMTSDDDDREWRCRLRNTDQHAVFVTAVDCSDASGCSKAVKVGTPTVMLILIIVIAVLFLSMIISIIVMTTKLWRRTKKASGSYTNSNNFLPVSTDQSWSSSQEQSIYHTPHDLNLTHRDVEQTPPKLYSPPTSSVYIPMSAVKALPEDAVDSHRFKRSESIYSNTETCERDVKAGTNSSAGSSDSQATTMDNLKGWV